MPREFGVPEDVIADVVLRKAPMATYSPFLSPIHGKHIIGINAAFRLGRWVDIMFFGDGHYYFNNKQDLDAFPNLRVTCNSNVNKPTLPQIKYTPRDGTHLFGLTEKKNMVSWNKNSGACAISLAHKLGAKRIILLGFDMMTSPNGQQHWHGEYPSSLKPRRPEQLPFKTHLQAFGPISRDAERYGIEILLVGKSAITEIRKVELKDVL